MGRGGRSRPRTVEATANGLRDDLGYSPVFLRYNTGLHVSVNGRTLAEILELLQDQWPVPITELVLIGHSMGGLVARSACHYGAELQHGWGRRRQSGGVSGLAASGYRPGERREHRVVGISSVCPKTRANRKPF